MWVFVFTILIVRDEMCCNIVGGMSKLFNVKWILYFICEE